MSSLLADKWAEWSSKASAKVAQFKNETFKNAVLAICGLIAAADGKIQDEEKEDVASLIEKNSHLSIFDSTDLRHIFLANCDKALDKFSRLDLVDLAKKLSSHKDQADTAMRIGLIIANADGVFEDSEKKVVVELCKALGLSPADYDC